VRVALRPSSGARIVESLAAGGIDGAAAAFRVEKALWYLRPDG
jgi:hypothetical protein